MARDDDDSRGALRIQLLLAATGLVLGFMALPALVFFVGQELIGSYAGGAHRLGSFYGNLFADLGKGSAIAWTIVLGPYVLLVLLRLVFVVGRTRKEEEDGEPPPRQERVRKEPKVT